MFSCATTPRVIVLSTLLGTLISASPGRADLEPTPSLPDRPAATQPSIDGNDKAETSVHDDSLDAIELFDLEVPVVVTATRREQQITSVPYAISVITAEDIRWAGARSVPDALRLVPGMDVAELSYGNAAVAPRGFHGLLSRQVLVLVDGRQIYDSLFGGTVWGSWPFQLEDIERIEVIRGPAGVAWGANAVNGVINVITKDPADQLGFTFTGGGGSRGYNKEHVGYAFADSKLRMRVSGEHEGSDGFKDGGVLIWPLQDDYKAGRFNAHAVYDKGPADTLTFSAGSAVGDGGFPATPLAGLGGTRHPGSLTSFLLGNWSHKISDDESAEITGYVNAIQGSPGIRAVDYLYQQFALQFRHTLRPTEQHLVTWGLDGRADLLDGTNSDPFLLSEGFVSTGIIGLYVQDEWRFAPRWVAHLGGRVDYEFYGGFEPSARGAVTYELTENSVLYGAVSRAFQVLPVGLRFLDLPGMNGLARATGRRDVETEQLLAYELGYRATLFNKLQLNLNLFWHEFTDLTTLSPRLGPPALLRLDLDNRAATSLYGVELDAKYALTKQLSILGNYTFQQLDWRSTVPFIDKELITPPRHKFMIGARYSPTDDLHLSSYLYYTGDVTAPNPPILFVGKRIDDYLRLDLRAEYEFWEDRASVSVGVHNLLDSHHPEGGTLFLNQAEVPRMVFAEFRIHLE